MEKDALKQIIAFELEAYCPEGTNVEGCADGIADRLGDGSAPNFYRVRSIVLDGLQPLESCLVEAEMEELATEIAEALCPESFDQEDDCPNEISDVEVDDE